MGYLPATIARENACELRVCRATEIDVCVGRRIRERRMVLGLSQQQLGQRLGCAYQQVQKYERGLNRVSAGRLYELSQALNIPISWFFDGLSGYDVEVDGSPPDRMLLDLMRNISQIGDETRLETLCLIVAALVRK